MQRGIDWVVRATDVVTVAIMIAMFGVMLTGIVFRYILNDSLQWSDELLVWGLVWVIMLGSVGVMAQWRHVYVPVCVLALPIRWRIPTVILSKIVTMIFIALVVYYGIQVFQFRFHRVSASLDLSSRWEKLAMPVGAALMLWVGVLQIVLDIRAWLGGELSRFASYGDSDLDI
jgi:TRAP-type C4-dicarboxylate transport system permease small subunit